MVELPYQDPLPVIEPPAINLVQLAQRFKALSDPKRLLILHTLMEGVQCNCELGEALQMPANLISHHLRILREAESKEIVAVSGRKERFSATKNGITADRAFQRPAPTRRSWQLAF